MTDFIFTIKHLLPQTKKENKVLQEKYKDNPMGLVQYVKEKESDIIMLHTALYSPQLNPIVPLRVSLPFCQGKWYGNI